MRRLALFCGGFAAGIFLAQYLLPDGWLLPVGLVCLGAGILALFLPEQWDGTGCICGRSAHRWKRWLAAARR